MNIEEASRIVDRLNIVFQGSGSDIPTAAELHEAITLLATSISKHGGDSKIPAGITSDQAIFNAATAKEVDALRNYAIAIVQAAEEAEILHSALSEPTKKLVKLRKRL